MNNHIAYILQEGYWNKIRVFLDLETACRYTAKAILKLRIEDGIEGKKIGYREGEEYLEKYLKIKDDPTAMKKEEERTYQEEINPNLFPKDKNYMYGYNMLLERFEIINKVE